MKYNPETDYIQVKSNGQWVNYRKVGLLSLPIFENGILYGDSLTKGAEKGLNYSISNNNLVITRPSSIYGTLYTNEPIDISDYKKLTVVVTSVSNIERFYVGFTTDITIGDGFTNQTSMNSANTYTVDISNTIGEQYFIMGLSSQAGGTVTISKIILE